MSTETIPHDNHKGPLADCLVFDFTRHLAGPFATMILRDLGACVIKFESPAGDPARWTGPFQGEDSAYFHAINRGKSSVVIDLRSAADVERVRCLLHAADCLVENFRPGVMAAAGLGPDEALTANPRLVYASCSGFGANGPLRHRQAFDVVIQAMGGVMSVTGPSRGGPTRVGISQADIVAGIFTALAVCSALVARAETGSGSVIDLSMYEAQLALMTHAIGIASATGEDPRRIGNRHPMLAPFDVFPAKDGEVAIAAPDDRSFRALCEALGLAGLAEDERFASKPSRLTHVDALTAELARGTATLTKQEITDRLERASVASGPVACISDILADQHLAAREALTRVIPWGTAADGLTVPALPFLLDGRRPVESSRAPGLGDLPLADLETVCRNRIRRPQARTERHNTAGPRAAHGP